MGSPYSQHAQVYQKQQIETASREQILLMLYDGAIRFLVIAKKAIDDKDIAKANTHLIKAQKIITEFMVSLDFEIGGDIAKNLYALYDYFNYRLVQANIHQDTGMVDEVLTHLRQLRATWDEAIKLAAAEAPAQASPCSIGTIPAALPAPRKTGERSIMPSPDSMETSGRSYTV